MVFPAEFRIDYIRVWQRKGLGSEYSTCDPTGRLSVFIMLCLIALTSLGLGSDYPTADYIDR